MRRERFPRYDKGAIHAGKRTSRKTQRKGLAKQMEKDMQIITSNSQLNEFFSKKIGNITHLEGREERKKTLETIIALTKEFARQNSITWRLP